MVYYSMKKKTFESWMEQVDAEVSQRVGVGYMDLLDMDYGGMFEDGISPKRAAIRAIRNAME